jgi:hypothetical protein
LNWVGKLSPAGVISLDQTALLMSVLTNFTEPSHIVTTTPPGCLL